MIGDISLAANIYIVTGYTDMRKSIDGLCAIVVEQLKEGPNGHSIYLFGYSCAMKSHFRKFGNQMSGSGNHLCEFTRVMFYLDRVCE